MGKLTLMFVMVAILGGSLLTFRTRMNSNDTTRERVDAQSSRLARDVATSGHALVLNAMMAEDGFNSSLPFNEQEMADGRIVVDEYTTSADRRQVSFALTAYAGGATHTIQSGYEWDPADFPGPIWMDVPYASATVAEGATIDGGADARSVHFDTRKYEELNLSSILSWREMADAMSGQFSGARGTGGDFYSSDMEAEGFLDPVNSNDATELYFKGLRAMNASDLTIDGPVTIRNETRDFGSDTRIVLVTGDLNVHNAAIEGRGLLIVEGGLTLSGDSPRLKWEGIVLVHSEDMYLPVTMDENASVDIDGALVINHIAIPPGGHMDLTVFHSQSGEWREPAGTRGRFWGRRYPWYQHTHRFDVDMPEERTVFFAEGRRDRHELRTQFRTMLNHLGSREVYLEFSNINHHGYSSYTLDIAGEPEVYTGSVASGFGSFSDPGNAFRTQTFTAQDLKTLIVDVSSLRLLMKAWDNRTDCREWPICVGDAWNRREALSVRLLDANTGNLHYEASMYWHMRQEEIAEHEREEAEIMAQIRNGTLFGTNLSIGKHVDITYDIAEISAIGSRLAFDQGRMLSTSASVSHQSPQDVRAAAAAGDGSADPNAGEGGGPSGAYEPPPEEQSLVCHQGREQYVNIHALPAHLGHGDTLGACP